MGALIEDRYPCRIDSVEYEVQVVRPDQLCAEDMAACLSIIGEGSAVDPTWAKRKLPKAEWVAIVKAENAIVAVGAIKQKRPDRAAAVSKKSNFQFDANTSELGYIARRPSHRGQHLSSKIVQALLSTTQARALFAVTSHPAMKETLRQFGFTQEGDEWPARIGSGQLSLWIKRAAGDPQS